MIITIASLKMRRICAECKDIDESDSADARQYIHKYDGEDDQL